MKLLKNIFALFLISSFSSQIFASDTIKPYGRINKELQIVSQDKKFNYKTHSGVVEVENAESLVGVKGSQTVDDLEFSYKIEMGVNSAKPDSAANAEYKATSGRIRVRQALAKVKSSWGTFKFGQTYSLSGMLQTKKLDPLAHTSAGLKSLSHDTNFEVPHAVKSIGSYYRGRKDGWGYKSPELKGLSYSVWTDHNDDSDLDPATTVGIEYWEHMLEYNLSISDAQLTLYLLKITWSAPGKEDESSGLLGWKLGLNKLIFQGSIGRQTETTTATDLEATKAYLQAGVSYKLSDNKTVAFTYGNRATDGGDSTIKTDEYKMNQIAVGYMHDFNDHIRMNLIGYKFTYAEEDATLTDTNDNSGTVIALGTTIKF